MVDLLKTNDMLTVCIDSNVYISAFGYNGNPAKVIDCALDRMFYLVLSSHIITEVKRNLRKMLFTDAEIDSFLDDIVSIATLYEPEGDIKSTSIINKIA